MSRAFVVVCMLLIAACEAKGALELVVPSTPNVSSVRLYFGIGDNKSRPIGPEGFATPLGPNRWRGRDEFAAADVRDMPSGGEVVFQLMPGDAGEDKLAIAILVGFDDQKLPIAVAKLDDLKIPHDSIARHFVTLTPLPDQNVEVLTWPRGANTCVAYNDGAAPGGVEMVVDPTDPDCDGFVENECIDNVYKATTSASLDEVTCLKGQPVTQNGTLVVDTCVLGGPQCVDGLGMQTSCEPTPYCMPQSVCVKCGQRTGLPCAMNLFSQFDYMTLPTYILCQTGRDPNTGALCGDAMTVTLGLPLHGAKCTGEIEVSTGAGFGPMAHVVSTPLGDVTFEVSALQDNCDFTFKATGTFSSANPNGAAAALVAGMLDSKRGFAIPIIVNTEVGLTCGASVTCDLVSQTNDLMDECLNTPILAP